MAWLKTYKGSLLNLDCLECIGIKEIGSLYRIVGFVLGVDEDQYYLSKDFNTRQEAEVFLHELYEKIQ
jgi:hypothetical protein